MDTLTWIIVALVFAAALVAPALVWLICMAIAAATPTPAAARPAEQAGPLFVRAFAADSRYRISRMNADIMKPRVTRVIGALSVIFLPLAAVFAFVEPGWLANPGATGTLAVVLVGVFVVALVGLYLAVLVLIVWSWSIPVIQNARVLLAMSRLSEEEADAVRHP